MNVSVVIPAHNEEHFLPRCLDSVGKARDVFGEGIEIIVVCNRCSDRTALIARSHGCVTLADDSRCLARIRNRGVARASGEIIITIDADSWMTPGLIREVVGKLQSGRYVGGGAWIYPERLSLGIVCSLLVVAPFVAFRGISAGLFWFCKRDFDIIGGFDESLVSVEDLDFALRLKGLGKRTGRRYGTARRNHIWTSCRKFDRFGDWYLARNPRLVAAIFSGRDRPAADHFYYDAGDPKA
jgi:glycosyltransferase involved in cell wall biosynthesis